MTLKSYIIGRHVKSLLENLKTIYRMELYVYKYFFT